MNDEYRRLEAEAIEVEARIAGLIGAAGAGTASDTDGVRQESELRLLLPYLKRLQVKHASEEKEEKVSGTDNGRIDVGHASPAGDGC